MTYPSKVRPSTRMIFGTALDSISFHLEKIQIFFFIWLSQLLVWTRVDFLRCSLSNRVSKLWTLLLFLGQQSLTKFCVIVNSDGAIATPIWVKLSSQKIHLSKSRDHRQPGWLLQFRLHISKFASTFQVSIQRFEIHFFPRLRPIFLSKQILLFLNNFFRAFSASSKNSTWSETWKKSFKNLNSTVRKSRSAVVWHFRCTQPIFCLISIYDFVRQTLESLKL